MWQVRCTASWGADAMSVVLSLKYEAHTKFEVRQPIRSWLITFYCDTLCYTVNFDPSTLNIFNVLAVMWSNSVPNFSTFWQPVKISGEVGENAKWEDQAYSMTKPMVCIDGQLISSPDK